MSKRVRRKKIVHTDIENDPKHILEAQQLNKVILAKCVMAVISNRPVTFRTKNEGDFVITPKIAKRLMRMAQTKSHVTKR